jgi:hypothetical protein
MFCCIKKRFRSVGHAGCCDTHAWARKATGYRCIKGRRLPATALLHWSLKVLQLQLAALTGRPGHKSPAACCASKTMSGMPPGRVTALQQAYTTQGAHMCREPVGLASTLGVAPAVGVLGKRCVMSANHQNSHEAKAYAVFTRKGLSRPPSYSSISQVCTAAAATRDVSLQSFTKVKHKHRGHTLSTSTVEGVTSNIP